MKKHALILAAIFISMQVVAQTGLKKGAKAPGFTVKDNSGKMIDLSRLLKSHKAVVLFFYRGQWCPYCNKYMQQLQDSLQMLEGRGAYVVGVTPETSENIEKTIGKTHASFSIIQDKGYRIMKDYQVLYTVDDATFSTAIMSISRCATSPSPKPVLSAVEGESAGVRHRLHNNPNS